MNIVLDNLTLALYNTSIIISLKLLAIFFYLRKCIHVFGPHWANKTLFIFYYKACGYSSHIKYENKNVRNLL